MVEDRVLRAVLTFLTMLATTCTVFAAVGILTWRMALAVLIGSALGTALARISLAPGARRPVAARSSRSGSAQ
jgi:uncharacterized membrane protein YfbV (UPF0208 family)